MDSVPSGSDPEIPEKHRVVGSMLAVSGCPASFAIANRKIYNPKSDCQGGEIGRRAGLRIPKSSISKRFFSFQKTIDLREENAIFHDQCHVFQ
jgi:hypothetical protein